MKWLYIFKTNSRPYFTIVIMSEKKNKNKENIAVGLSSAAGSLMGTVSANSAINRIKDIDQQSDDEIVDQHTENPDNIEVISYSHDDNIQGNVIEHPSPARITTFDSIPTEISEPVIEEPEPNTIVDIMYAGPAPSPDPIDPNFDPIVCVYGPPEPDIINDIDDPTDDFLAGI